MLSTRIFFRARELRKLRGELVYTQNTPSSDWQFVQRYKSKAVIVLSVLARQCFFIFGTRQITTKALPNDEFSFLPTTSTTCAAAAALKFAPKQKYDKMKMLVTLSHHRLFGVSVSTTADCVIIQLDVVMWYDHVISSCHVTSGFLFANTLRH